MFESLFFHPKCEMYNFKQRIIRDFIETKAFQF